MSITWADVLYIAPELSTAASGTRTAILAQVDLMVSEDWGDLEDTAKVYLAAHLGTLSSRRGVGGPVMSESVGGVSRSYSVAVGATGATQLGSTSYGIEYERMASLIPAFRFDISGGI